LIIPAESRDPFYGWLAISIRTLRILPFFRDVFGADQRIRKKNAAIDPRG
jgi:hypothetical protein